MNEFEFYNRCGDKFVRRQLAFMLARQQIVFDLTDVLPDEDYEEVEVLTQIMSNMKLNESFLALARELDIMEPKTPEDVYKVRTVIFQTGHDHHTTICACSV